MAEDEPFREEDDPSIRRLPTLTTSGSGAEEDEGLTPTQIIAGVVIFNASFIGILKLVDYIFQHLQ